jgi:hypothetical protein
MKIGIDTLTLDTIYCVVKVCYCYSPPISPSDDNPNFELKKIIFQDPGCYGKINPNIFKKSFLELVIALHMNDLPPVPCIENIHWTGTLITAQCYVDGFVNGQPVCFPCNGNGFCAQAYIYCIDYSQIPPKVIVTTVGPPMQFGSIDCVLPPFVGPGDYPVGDCTWWCGE